MTISKRIRSQLFISTSADESSTTTTTITATLDAERMLIRLPLNRPLPGARKRPSRAKKYLGGAQNGFGWSDEEHERFLRGLEMFPTGPWKDVTAFVGTRTTRQVMTHAQKYRQKIARRQRGLQIPVRKPRPVAPSSFDALSTECATAEITMKSCVATVTPPFVPVQEQIKNEKTGLSMELSMPTTAFGFSFHSTKTSPSSTDHVMSELSLYSPNAVTLGGLSARMPGNSSSYYSSFPPVAMSPDEFRLVTDELYAEALWMNQFGDDDQMNALLMPTHHPLEDPLALMFQDPNSNSLSWPPQNKSLAMDIVYPTTAHASMVHASVNAPYECQL